MKARIADWWEYSGRAERLRMDARHAGHPFINLWRWCRRRPSLEEQEAMEWFVDTLLLQQERNEKLRRSFGLIIDFAHPDDIEGEWEHKYEPDRWPRRTRVVNMGGMFKTYTKSSATAKDREKARGPRHPRTARRVK
jgi:hypothetical protein